MDRIQFSVNGTKQSVGCEVDSDVTLNDYLRKHLNLRGTKYMCKEGGCGACVVAVRDPKRNCTFSVNSCLVSIPSCKDWEITTIEEIGNRGKGYHEVQKTLAEHNGTQCGYCSPGWVMSMYSLLEKRRGKLTMREVEDSFGSNTCRCTGYRPILEAFKTFATDSEKSNKIMDIEDLNRMCERTGKMCNKKKCDDDDEDWCFIKEEELRQEKVLEIHLKDNKKWYRANTLNDVFDIFGKEGLDSYMLVAGNTAKGAYPIDEYPNVLIDISEVLSLKEHILDQNLILGAGATLTEATEVFDEVSSEDGFDYLEKFSAHIKLVAHIPVKNIGTIAGNLMIKHQHNDFPSDLFLLFETVGAMLTIQSKKGRQVVTLEDFLKINMKGKVITNVLIPPFNKEYSFVSYKIMPRSQNAHAIVNAGFLYKIKNYNNTIEMASIVFGGLSPKFVHAKKTEAYLVGKVLCNNETLQGALKILQNELVVEPNPPEPSVEYRKKLALGLFYKGCLEICPSSILGESYHSGAIDLRLIRPVSNGKQVYDTNKAVWPLNEPITKVEALIQSAGEAPYIDDIFTLPNEVFAEFVLSTVAVGDIVNIDASSALALKGVLAFYTAKDIPGDNSFTPVDTVLHFVPEVVLANEKVIHFNQPIGIIVAVTEKLANRAAKMVKVVYKNTKKPVLSIDEAKTQPTRVIVAAINPATDTGLNIKKIFKGAAKILHQYHYTMETQVCVVRPSDDGLEVHSSCQWMDMVQIAIANSLKIQENRINMSLRRVGGAFGGKISRSIQVAVACALVSYKMNRPCRFIMPLTSVMRAIGKRLPCNSEFEVAVSGAGEIQHLEHKVYEDNGCIVNEPLTLLGIDIYSNCYNDKRWNFTAFNVTTDTHSNSWCRSPGTLEEICMAEMIMEQISYEMGLDQIKVREVNLLDEDPLREVFKSIKKESDYDNRKEFVRKFNEKNKWKKRGLGFAPLKWPVPNMGGFCVTLTVYHGDGSIAITHSGVEIGQGINTKVVQVCAYSLNMPIDKVKVKATNVISNPNSFTTGGSYTSEAICLGVVKCCQTLLERLAPIKTTAGDVAWEKLIELAHALGVDLFTSAKVVANSELKKYFVYGATVTEVEVDMLTGESQVLRVDLLEDVGQSLSPEIDVGQIEGAFVMGLGYWMSEHLIYSPNTGELLTDRSWTYHVPLAKDIPIDFRVYFKRNSFNDLGVLGSKATGEPAICMSISVQFALRQAIASARLDKGIPTTKWFNLDGPCTTESIILAANTKLEHFKFY